MITCRGCGLQGVFLCADCATIANQKALEQHNQNESPSQIEFRAIEQYSLQDNSEEEQALERSMLNAGWEHSSANYEEYNSYDSAMNSFEEPDEYEE